MRPKRPSLVIFDCDGVLIDSETPANRVFAAALRDIGLSITAAECHRRYTGMSYRDCLSDIEARLNGPVPEDWLSGLRARVHAALRAEAVAVPFALNAVRAVHAAGSALCVASSSNPDYLQEFLGRTGFTPYFGARLFSAKMVARGKPAPDLFLHAASAMTVAPAEAVVIEDSLPGVRGAVAAGMRVFGYAGHPLANETALAAAGAHIVRDMRELPSLLGLDLIPA